MKAKAGLKKMTMPAMVAAMIFGSAMTSQAAGWQQDGTGWKWQNDDGTCITGG